MWLSIAAIAIAVVVAAALFAPVKVEVTVEKAADESATRVRIRVSWLGLSIPSQPARRPQAKARKKASASPVRWTSVRAALVSPGFVRRCARFARDLGRLALPDHLHLRGQIGFEDPAATGIFLGWIYALGARTPSTKSWSIQLSPQFGEPVVHGRLQLHWSRNIASIAWPLLTFAASPAVWRAWHRARHASRSSRHTWS